MTGLLSAWLAEVILITFRDAKQGTTAGNPIAHLPLPSEYASTFIVYGALAFIPGEGQKVATAIGWGLVLATFLNLWNPGGTVRGAVPAAASGPSTTGSTVTSAGATATGSGTTINQNTGTASTGGYPVKAQ